MIRDKSIKICVDPQCEAVWHNIPVKQTHCKDCGGRVMAVTEKAFWKQFSHNWFQYDFTTGEYLRPQIAYSQLSSDFESY